MWSELPIPNLGSETHFIFWVGLGISFYTHCVVLSGNEQSLLILIEPFNLKYMHNHLFRMTLPAFSTRGWWHWLINCAHNEMDFEYQHELIGRVLKSISGICPLQKHPTFAFCWRYHLALYTLKSYTNQASLATL